MTNKLEALRAAIEEEIARAKAEGGGDLSMVYLTIEDAKAVLGILEAATPDVKWLRSGPYKQGSAARKDALKSIEIGIRNLIRAHKKLYREWEEQRFPKVKP